ncbi:MAG: lactate utilization protein [DPANN group archaeon]|nr:lactate utilization protein [DPANN group archaeon]
MAWDELATDEVIDKTKAALESNGMQVLIVENAADALDKTLELIPQGAEVNLMSSMTLEAIGIPKAINESEKYDSVANKIRGIDEKEQRDAMRRASAAVDFAIGSVHAVTEDGKLVIASNTGSQLGTYAFGAKKQIFVIGTQKIVKNLDDGFKRIEEYAFPLEDQRALKAYSMHSGINKELIVHKEVMPGRITIVFVKEKLGF